MTQTAPPPTAPFRGPDGRFAKAPAADLPKIDFDIVPGGAGVAHAPDEVIVLGHRWTAADANGLTGSPIGLALALDLLAGARS